MLEKKHASYSRYAQRCEEADIRLGVALAAGKDHAGIRSLAALSEVGGWKSIFALSAGTVTWGLLSGNPRLASAGRRMLGASILASLAKTSAKHLVHRTRPNVLMETGLYTRGRLGPNVGPWQSFPSGHSALSVAAARALGRAYPEIRGAAYAGAAGIVLVQVLRGAHFPSDVIAGSLIGLAAEAGTNALAPRSMPQATGGTNG
ncbi:phosphatase PAP2 family protein [uncultured Methylobacterium sp.]|uniref:phosphatase PAP2 family protein n=1 Tax=uncultured Methylobacterium sp. TaxID=157278 RepID=UPI0035CA149E